MERKAGCSSERGGARGAREPEGIGLVALEQTATEVGVSGKQRLGARLPPVSGTQQ